MTDKPSKQLSRRDALKLLGAAAGASVLANLPSKWSTPRSVAGVLPAHAQTSFDLHSLDCFLLEFTGLEVGVQVTSHTIIAPPDAGISMHYRIIPTDLDVSIGLEGDVLTDGTGQALVTFVVSNFGAAPWVIVNWTFTNDAVSKGSCSTGNDPTSVL